MILTRLWFYNLGKIFALYSLMSLPCTSHHWLCFKKFQPGTAPPRFNRSYSNVQNNKRSKLKEEEKCSFLLYTVHQNGVLSLLWAPPLQPFNRESLSVWMLSTATSPKAALGSSCRRGDGPLATRESWVKGRVKAIQPVCSHRNLSYTPKRWADFPARLRSTQNNHPAEQEVFCFLHLLLLQDNPWTLGRLSSLFLCFMNNRPCARNQKRSISFI